MRGMGRSWACQLPCPLRRALQCSLCAGADSVAGLGQRFYARRGHMVPRRGRTAAGWARAQGWPHVGAVLSKSAHRLGSRNTGRFLSVTPGRFLRAMRLSPKSIVKDGGPLGCAPFKSKPSELSTGRSCRSNELGWLLRAWGTWAVHSTIFRAAPICAQSHMCDSARLGRVLINQDGRRCGSLEDPAFDEWNAQPAVVAMPFQKDANGVRRGGSSEAECAQLCLDDPTCTAVQVRRGAAACWSPDFAKLRTLAIPSHSPCHNQGSCVEVLGPGGEQIYTYVYI